MVVAVPVVNANDMAGLGLLSGKETLWIDRGWRAAAGKGVPVTPPLGSDYAEVDAACALSSFYRQPPLATTTEQPITDVSDPTPYATAMLLSQLPGQRPDHLEVHIFLCIPCEFNSNYGTCLSASALIALLTGFHSLSRRICKWKLVVSEEKSFISWSAKHN